MSGLGPGGLRRGAVDRRADRLVAVTGIGLAIGFLGLAAATALLSPTMRLGAWLPLHLAMAGAASVAIAGVMPFFSAAIAMAQPVASTIRWGALLAVTAGAAGLTFGFAIGERSWAAMGGITFILGITLVAYATLAPIRGALGPRGGAVIAGYAAALGFVITGAAMATAMLLGVAAVSANWLLLKPAHAWLGLVGFISLVIASTLLHFFPTVVGARIRRTRSSAATVAGLGLGAPLVAVAFIAGSDLLARVGALCTLVGAVGLAVYALGTWRSRARWSGDAGWHVFAMGGLVSAIAWFEVSVGLAALRLLLVGADPVQAGADLLVAPFVAGWMGLAVLASATHLVPSVGPGGPLAHAHQRERLGRGGASRLMAADAGIAGLVLGYPLGIDALVVGGMALVVIALAGTGALVALAIVTGVVDARRSGMLRT